MEKEKIVVENEIREQKVYSWKQLKEDFFSWTLLYIYAWVLIPIYLMSFILFTPDCSQSLEGSLWDFGSTCGKQLRNLFLYPLQFFGFFYAICFVPRFLQASYNSLVPSERKQTNIVRKEGMPFTYWHFSENKFKRVIGLFNIYLDFTIGLILCLGVTILVILSIYYSIIE